MATRTKKAPAKPREEVVTIESLRAAINKHFGPGTIEKASADKFAVKRLPFGILSIDWRMGGGVARGRHTEIYGPNNVGKTYATLCLIARTQADGGRCAFVNVEDTFDKKFAAHIGVDLEALDLIPHRHGNQVVDIMQTLISSGLYDVVACDSIAALLPKSELDVDMEAGSYGTAQAKLMSAALRRLTTVNTGRTAVVWINQIREAIGVSFGKRTRTSGGMAMSFYATTRIEMVKTEVLKRTAPVVNQKTGTTTRGKIPVGHRALVRIEKDKSGIRPLSETTFVFNYDQGRHDHIEDLIYIGLITGLIHKKGDLKWWVDGYDDHVISGRAKFKAWLKTNSEVAEELEGEIWDNLPDSDWEDLDDEEEVEDGDE